MLSRAPEDAKVNWLVVILLIAMNFFAFGSMLSSLSIVLSINISYVILVILSSIKLGEKALIRAIIRVVVIVLLTLGVLLFMFIQTVVFGMSLGLPRNGVFLLPLALISSGIFMDRAANALLRIKILPFLLRSVCIVLLTTLFFLNLPSPRAVDVRPYDWSKQSSVGPLVRMLRQIDPDKAWRIKLTSPYLAALEKPLKYYAKFGYNVERVTKDYDVVVLSEHSPDSRFVYFENEFFKDRHCCIAVNTSSFSDK